MMSDLISRQQAMHAFLADLTRRERKNLLHTWSTVEVKYYIAEILEHLPAVDSVKHGKWLCSDDMYEYAFCSVCKKDTEEPFDFVKDHWHYCPSCGTKMDGEKADE